MNVERTIWSIFTYATLHGNPRDPSKLTSIGLQKLCRECRLYDIGLVDKPVTQTVVHLIFAQEAKLVCEKIDPNLLDRKVVERVDYDGFLSCMNRIASLCYPNSANADEAMLHLLMDNVLPLASRRNILRVQHVMEEAAVVTLFTFFENSIKAVFDFYAANATNSKGTKTMTRVTASSVHKSFDDHQAQVDAMEKQKEGKMKAAKSGTTVGYDEFLRFSVDFGVTSSLGLTTLDVGDIYLSVCSHSDYHIQGVNFEEFWESMVRCALKAFKDYNKLSNGIKVKCFLLYIWRHIQASIREQMHGENNTGDLSSYKGGLIRGAQLLNERFLSMWAKDNYQDYLLGEAVTHASFTVGSSGDGRAAILLDSITNPQKMAPVAADERNGEDDETNGDKKIAQPHVVIDIHDDDDVGDARIEPALLRSLLQERQDLALLLYDCAVDAGLLSNEEKGEGEWLEGDESGSQSPAGRRSHNASFDTDACGSAEENE